tara:strand:+ start:574 stop:840 length:267 start_codon:yes stop_codon:yes gene_type:complete
MTVSKRSVDRRKKKQAEKELKTKMGMFSRLPDNCGACLKDFDKQDKEMVQSWTVVVKEKEKKVNLYCPECWATAQSAVEQFYKEKDNA